jgi:class 3 adenylate cyclase
VDTHSALIVFVDVIDSSIHSAVSGISSYAEQLLRLHKLFGDLGDIYFPKKDPVISFSEIQVRGDEGTIFYVDPDSAPEELVHRAVQFAFELKARIELLNQINDIDVSPKKMKIGVGIHFGEVALVPSLGSDEHGTPRSVIGGILGYSINYAKRIESSSRIGKYSKIFLSKEAAFLLKGDPVVLVPHEAPLEGIERKEEVYEVRSAFFNEMPLDPKNFDSEKFIETFTNDVGERDLIREPWLKGLIISVIDARLKNVTTDSLKSYYSEKRTKFAWRIPTEDDPIVLYCRAIECFENSKHTSMLGYLKKVIKDFPNFVHARIKLAQACWEVTQQTSVRAEWVLARDTADEYLSRYPDLLSNDEKIYYKKILSGCRKKHSSRRVQKAIRK